MFLIHNIYVTTTSAKAIALHLTSTEQVQLSHQRPKEYCLNLIVVYLMNCYVKKNPTILVCVMTGVSCLRGLKTILQSFQLIPYSLGQVFTNLFLEVLAQVLAFLEPVVFWDIKQLLMSMSPRPSMLMESSFGTYPIGLTFATSSLLQRFTTHSRTRQFSPNPVDNKLTY